MLLKKDTMNPIVKIFKNFSEKAREKRKRIFLSQFSIDEDTKILDLGSEEGDNINAVLQGTKVKNKNVYIADINAEAVLKGNKKYGFTPVIIDDQKTLPFSYKYFDIVYCSSVIEHVTIPKEEVWELSSATKFETQSRIRQKEFSREIQRLGKQYFVQTPYKYFPLESHTWLPFIVLLPRRLLVPTLRFTNLFWAKKTCPDWYLLNKEDMSLLFKEAKLIEEKAFGLTKSIMAVSIKSRGANQ